MTVELAARLYDRFSPAPPGREEFLRNLPAPYAGAPYLSEEFIEEIVAFTAAVQSATRDQRPLPDFTGTFFNIRSGMRATTGQPVSYSNTVHVFGGSTVFSNEVPDWLTIPSLLQDSFRDRFGDRFIVLNRGIPGATAREQARFLRSVEVNEGDVVVFYDGTNEISHSIFYGNAAPEIAQGPNLSPEAWSVAERLIHFLWRNLHSHSTFIRRFLNLENNRSGTAPLHLQATESLQRLLARTQTEYREALQEAHAFSQARGASFVHFLQPTIFTQAQNTAYEDDLIQNHNIVFNGLRIAHERGYPSLRQALRELDGEILSYDLSDAFDDRPDGEEYFIDDCHVTHSANAIVAQRIFERVVLVIEAGRDSRSAPRARLWMPRVRSGDEYVG